MHFRFSEYAKRGKSANPFEGADCNNTGRPRPSTANSYDFRSSYSMPPTPLPPPPPQHPWIPDREDTATPASFTYDNGTGILDPRLVRENDLPSDVRTAAQLAHFIKYRRPRKGEPEPANLSPTACSRYSYTITCPPSPAGPRRSSSTRVSAPREASRRPTRTYVIKAGANPAIVSGLRTKYAGAPVGRILPGSTRKHEHQGFWLRRRTMRKVDADQKDRKKGRAKSEQKRPTTADGPAPYVETSGWYSSDSD